MKLPLRIFLAIAATAVVLIVAAQLKSLPGEKPTPAGWPINSSHYVTSADGTRIAVELWLPADLSADSRIPALIEGSRYWRGTRVTLLGRMMNLFGLDAPGAMADPFARYFNARNYAYVSVEVRGTGASFGVHDTEYSRQEIADYAAILDWIITQPWSNGRVGAVGVSYAGTTAELMTTLGHPALKAVAPLFADFDAQYGLVTPGGVYQPEFVEIWNALVGAMDRDDLCGVMAAGGEKIEGLKCLIAEAVAGGTRPVDGPDGMALLDAAVAEHNSPDVIDLVRTLDYRDSAWGDVDYTTMQALPYGRKAEIEASGLPMYIVTGWFDAATTDGALARFASFSNPQVVTIGPFSHGGGRDTDPYAAAEGDLAISGAEQMRRLEQFFARYLKDESSAQNKSTPPVHRLRYFVQGSRAQGEGLWREVNQWPPADLVREQLYLQPQQQLTRVLPPSADAADTLHVDFTTGVPGTSRWLTQLGGSDVVYPQRNEAVAGALTYTTDAMTETKELTGNVIVDLWISSTAEDGVVHVYLDDLAPDGSSRYLSEGLLRLIHRKEQSEPFYPQFGPAHSFLEADARPMPIGEPQQLRFSLFATSALIQAGHKLRIAISGADASSFARYPAQGDAPTLTIHRSSVHASSISLPFRDSPAPASPASADKAPAPPAETSASSH